MTNAELFSLDGRVALVTGGNGGLGLVLADALASAGARVVVTGRDSPKNEAVGRHEVARLEVRDEAAVRQVVDKVVERHGHLDVLVNNAGVFRDQSLVDPADQSWDEVLGTNLTGAMLCSRHAARAMVAGGRGGKIINIGSMYSLFGHPAAAGYAASKAGVVGLTRALAVELGVHGIQVNAIAPGWFPTDMNAGLPGSARGEDIRRRTPAGRWGEGQDLAGAAVFLASQASDFVTGALLPVDGGYSVSDRAVR